MYMTKHLDESCFCYGVGGKGLFTVSMLKLYISCFENSVNPEQLAA